MLAGALFNRAVDIFRRLVDLQADGVTIESDLARALSGADVLIDFTRPEVQRLLLLVRAIAEPLSARIEMDQEAVGTQRLRLRWPVHSGRVEQEGV